MFILTHDQEYKKEEKAISHILKLPLILLYAPPNIWQNPIRAQYQDELMFNQ